eukprot:CAMPEP_0197196136 /NCGR_PEP_ID=MMETSP1423-20130617/32193_1 /TAXON_ID=476441 /ORGANISM="Pseudo-nitzschia heimii, Strain UNC1101" /LENGTH=240 /DNA_ID=CAMNT_0042649909 /DNA_START=143 /DNA_END=865 /DNA_ORIENTATION=-
MGSDNGGGTTWSQFGSSCGNKICIAVTVFVFVIFASQGGNSSEGVYSLREGQKHQQTGGAKYDNTYWRELPSDAKKAAMRLGYNEKSWDHSIDPSITNKPWQALIVEEKAAASTLGYNQKTWNREESDSEESESEETSPPTSSGTASGTSSGTASNKPWQALVVEEKAAASTLGYNQKTWNREESDSEEFESEETESGTESGTASGTESDTESGTESETLSGTFIPTGDDPDESVEDVFS